MRDEGQARERIVFMGDCAPDPNRLQILWAHVPDIFAREIGNVAIPRNRMGRDRCL